MTDLFKRSAGTYPGVPTTRDRSILHEERVTEARELWNAVLWSQALRPHTELQTFSPALVCVLPVAGGRSVASGA